MSTDNRFERAIALFDAANAEDPRMDHDHGEAVPRELLYARRMSEMLERFAPEAPEAVKLAVRAQHVQRWKIARDAYPMDRTGYLRWRARLYEFHADAAGGLMKAAGYDDEMIQRVQDAVGKKGLKVNPETQMLEDVSALVFLEHYVLEFAGHNPDYTEEKWVDILRKTWRKMSGGAHDFVRCGKIELPAALAPLIEKATTCAS
ncbi:MAG: DUF4202 domain-containing protein [Myxococcales bacterium]